MTVEGYTHVASDDYDLAHQHAVHEKQMNEMHEVVGVPTVGAVLPPGVNVSQLWATGLFDCFSNGANLCCNVYACTPCMAGRIHSAVNGIQGKMDECVCAALLTASVIGTGLSLLPLMTHGQFGIPCIDLLGPCAFAWYTWWQRQTIRQQYGIQGDTCGDCLVSFFCPSCAMCQHHTELVQRGVDPGLCCCESATPRPPQQVVYVQQPAYAVQPQQVVYGQQSGCAVQQNAYDVYM